MDSSFMLLLITLISISVIVSSFLGTVLGNLVSRKEVNIGNPVKAIQQKIEDVKQESIQKAEYEQFQKLYPSWLYHEKPEETNEEVSKGW